MEQLIAGLVDRKVNELAYLGFSELDDWFEDRLGLRITFDQTLRSTVIELIETRNIIVHNRSYVNEKYLRNMPNSLLKIGERRPIDIDYLIAAVDTLDTIVTSLDEQLGNKFSLEMQALK